MSEKTKVTGVMCKVCKDIIFSRARHDYHTCSCGASTIDGGFDYLRFGWNTTVGDNGAVYTGNQQRPIVVIGELDISKKAIYNDWNKSIDKYGIVKEADPLYKNFSPTDDNGEQ